MKHFRLLLFTTLLTLFATVAMGQTYDTTANTSDIDEFDSAVYMRLHFDGQTGNPAAVLDWSVYLPKNTGAPLRGLGFARDRQTS